VQVRQAQANWMIFLTPDPVGDLYESQLTNRARGPQDLFTGTEIDAIQQVLENIQAAGRASDCSVVDARVLRHANPA
jgi:hypothetical protein